MEVGTRTYSRGVLDLLKSADWCGYLDADYDVINVAVSVLFHAGGSGADPSS